MGVPPFNTKVGANQCIFSTPRGAQSQACIAPAGQHPAAAWAWQPQQRIHTVVLQESGKASAVCSIAAKLSFVSSQTKQKKAAQGIAAIMYASLQQFPEEEQQKRLKEIKKIDAK